MKVLWLAPHPLPTKKGMHPAPWITVLAAQLAQRGISITIVATGKRLEAPVLEYSFDSYKLVVLDMPGGYLDLLTLFRKRINTIRDYVASVIHEYDLVHVHGTEHQLASALKNINIPVVISIQGLIFKYKKYIKDFFTIRRINWEISSFYERKEISDNKNFICRTNWDKSSVLEVNSGASIFDIWELMRPDFYTSATDKFGDNILFSGGENSLKGLERCLRVFNKILETESRKLYVIGSCSWEYVEGIKKRYGLKNLNSDNVILEGLVNAEKIIQLYRDCFCLYHPSLIDNSPNSICEAQLSGLPVLAVNTGGVGSLIRDGETGILVNGQDLQEDYKKLKSLASDPTLQKRIGEKARKEALQRHDVNTITDKVINAYNHLLNEVA